MLPNGVPANSDLEVDSANAALRILMAYRDLAAGIHALHTCQMLLCRFGDEFQFRISVWAFDQLRHKLSKLQAIRDAIEADVVIISTHAQEELPDEIKKWIETWTPQKRGQTAALVALLDSTAEDSSEFSHTHAYLRNVAASGGLDFLPRQIQLAERERPSGVSFESTLQSMVNQDIDRPAPDRWGINE